MSIAAATKPAPAESDTCTECGVGKTDDSWCTWCQFWIQLAFARPATRERVMEERGRAAVWFAQHVGIDAAAVR